MSTRLKIIERAAEYCMSEEFEKLFDDFASEHAEAFYDAAESKDDEHKHEFKELHEDYLAIFEKELEKFIEDEEGETIESFFTECLLVQNNYNSLFGEHEHAWFIERLMACIDYSLFYDLMVNEARRQLRK